MSAFVMIFQGRCGSTYLMEGLNAHPEIECWFEYLSVLKKRKATPSDQLEWIERFITDANARPNCVMGFKTKLKDVLDLSGFEEFLRRTAVPIIHLQRRNIVKQTVSFFNSMRLHNKTGDWNLYDQDKAVEKLLVDVEEFDQWLLATTKRAEDELRFVSKLPNPTLPLFYEDMLQGEQHIFDLIFSFLEVDPCVVAGNAIKSTKDSLRDAVENFDELYSRYRDTVYEPMFREVQEAC